MRKNKLKISEFWLKLDKRTQEIRKNTRDIPRSNYDPVLKLRPFLAYLVYQPKSLTVMLCPSSLVLSVHTSACHIETSHLVDICTCIPPIYTSNTL